MTVARGGRVTADIGPFEKFLETILAVDIIVALQNRAPQALAETAGPQENGDLVILDLMDKPRLVHEITVLADNLLVVRHRVWNASFHKG